MNAANSTDNGISLCGIDMAWRPENNSSAMAFGDLTVTGLHVTDVLPAVMGLDAIKHALDQRPYIQGVAVDASLIINNPHGQRECEKALSKAYVKKKAGCHATNTQLYPNAASTQLSDYMLNLGYQHLAMPPLRWQIEVYPHPALIELFCLPERLMYKKGSVSDKRHGQQQLAAMLQSLQQNDLIPLSLAPALQCHVDADTISGLRGQALKCNEDALDAIVCAYIAAWYASAAPVKVFGDGQDGYMVVPTLSQQ